MEDLEALVGSKDQFLASISHEIPTPLTAVLGFSAALGEGAVGLEPGGMEIVNLVVQHVREIADIVEDLLGAARTDIHALIVASVSVALAEEARAVVDAGAPRTPDDKPIHDAAQRRSAIRSEFDRSFAA